MDGQGANLGQASWQDTGLPVRPRDRLQIKYIADLLGEYVRSLQLSMNDCTPFESNGGGLTVQIIIER